MNKILTYVFLGSALVALPLVSIAQQSADRGGKQSYAPLMPYEKYQVPTGPVTLYGQTLNPYLDYYEKPGEAGYEYIQKYNAYRWDDLRSKLPEVFPDAMVKKMTAEQLCDLVVPLDQGYIATMETNYYPLADAIRPYFPSLTEDLDFIDQVEIRLRSKDPSKLQELISMMPHDTEEEIMQSEAHVMMVKNFLLQSWTVSIIRDAALHNCPEYAKQKGYTTHTGPFPEEPQP